MSERSAAEAMRERARQVAAEAFEWSVASTIEALPLPEEDGGDYIDPNEIIFPPPKERLIPLHEKCEATIATLRSDLAEALRERDAWAGKCGAANAEVVLEEKRAEKAEAERDAERAARLRAEEHRDAVIIEFNALKLDRDQVDARAALSEPEAARGTDKCPGCSMLMYDHHDPSWPGCPGPPAAALRSELSEARRERDALKEALADDADSVAAERAARLRAEEALRKCIPLLDFVAADYEDGGTEFAARSIAAVARAALAQGGKEGA